MRAWGPLFGCLLAVATSAVAQADHVFVAGSGPLHYQTFGRGPVAVVFAGGPGSDPAYMVEVAEAVARNGYRAILLAQRRTGASQNADPARLTMAGSIEDVEDLRRTLGAAKITLVGHSFGTAVAQAYAAAHPAQVDRLVLIESVGTKLGAAPSPVDGWRKHLRPDELAAYDRLRAAGNRGAASEIKMLGSFDDRAKGTAYLKVHPIAPRDPAAALRLGDDYAAHFDLSVQPAPPGLRVEVLAGTDDWIRGYEPMLRTHYPQARFATIPNAGHFPWVENPAAFARALRIALTRP